MKKLIGRLIAILLCSLVPVQISYGQQADAPSHKDGDWWRVEIKSRLLPGVSRSACQDRYSEYMVKLDQGKIKVYGGAGNNLEEIECPSVAIWILGFVPAAQKDDFERYGSTEAQFEYVKFPLSVGKSWTQQVKEGTGQKNFRRVDIEYKVLSWEKVQTSKREFEAFKIEVQGWPGGQVRTYYYAPRAKGIVSFESKSGKKIRRLLITLLDLNVSE
jgi:hypothetical protein